MSTPAAISELENQASQLGVTALQVVVHGRTLVSVGDFARPVPLHSIRKSLVSMLFGQLHDRGLVDLRTPIGELGVDETPTLTSAERSATIEDLLCARSGVYLPRADGSSAAALPPRGSSKPGSVWVYNNWDFNVLGNIYERLTGESVFTAFDHHFADALGFVDWNLFEHGKFRYSEDVLGSTLRYPNYAFSLSVRDLIRIGELYVAGGLFRGRRLLSADWIATSTQPISRTTQPPGLCGMYGYCWWVAGPDSVGTADELPRETVSAVGLGGNFLTYIPTHGIVVAALTDAPPATTGPETRHARPLGIEEFGNFISHTVAALR